MSINNFAASAPLTSSEWAAWLPLFSALIASFVTIVGIVLNNYFARNHKKAEQAHSIKKEIYLAFAEYISNSTTLFQNLANPKSSLQELLSRFSERSGIIGKMYVVAEPNLLLEARALVTELETFGSEMVAIRQGMDKITLKVDDWKASREETSKALDNLNEHRLSLIRTGANPPESVQSAHQWEHELLTMRLNEVRDALYKAEVEEYHAALNLFEISVTASQIVEEKTLSTLRLIKEQLGIPYDAVNYEEQVRVQNTRRAEATRNLIEMRKTTTPLPE